MDVRGASPELRAPTVGDFLKEPTFDKQRRMVNLAKYRYHFLMKPSRWASGLFLIFTFTILFVNSPTNTSLAGTGTPKPQVTQGIFLVATKQLHGTSFQKTIILLTHYSNREVMGLAINRPTDIPLNQVFPKLNQIRNNTDLLYMGGPVRPKTLFVLAHTKQPKKGMRHVIDDIYFSSAKNSPSRRRLPADK